MQTFLYSIRQFLGRLSVSQKTAMAAVLLGTLALLAGMAYWAGKPEYALLFGGLEPTDASQVVESLRDQGIKYELKENGTAVYVPRKDVYELRLRFAGEGVISDGPAGYELFDQNTLGMTDFMQKLNMKRALEGELAKTISSIRQVEICRVHLVIPERTPFRETQTRPSASVVLKLANGGGLTQEQIEGIGALVAGAVENLSPADVTILDMQGSLLSNPDAGNPDLNAGSTQLRLQQAVEGRLTEKGQSMLDQVLGPGNAIVRVAATLDFTKAVTERDLIDPESATVISEERLEEGGADANANSSVRNYELSRSRERSEKSVGEISYLTVSVVLNYKMTPAPPDSVEALPTFDPYPEDKLAEIETLVKNSVGFQPDRGDRFAIHQTRFDTNGDWEMAAELRKQHEQEQLQLYIRYGLMVLALLAAALLVRSASRKVPIPADLPDAVVVEAPSALVQLEEGVEEVAGALEDGSNRKLPPLKKKLKGVLKDEEEEQEEVISLDDLYGSKLSNEARTRLKAKHLMYEEIKQQVTEQPEDAADLIRSWLLEDLQFEDETM